MVHEQQLQVHHASGMASQEISYYIDHVPGIEASIVQACYVTVAVVDVRAPSLCYRAGSKRSVFPLPADLNSDSLGSKCQVQARTTFHR